jgi:uncharacterized MAPEG superfamily protein
VANIDEKSETIPHAPSTSVEVPIIDAEVINPATTTAKPVVIVETEKSFAHYAGIAFLTVLAVFTFFVPGVAIVYLVSQITDINAPAAWIFSAILSLILWIGFKLKVKGLVRTTVFFLGFCTLILGLLFVIYFTSDTGNIFGNMANMLSGKSVP